jgi:hypothetical protein
MTSLPPERDLPEAARTAVRARIVTAAAPAPPGRRRRWTPGGAAAGLALVVLGIVDLAPRPDPGRAPGGAGPSVHRYHSPLPPTGPTDLASLTRRCIADAAGSGNVGVTVKGGSLLAHFEDRYGYLVWIGSSTYDVTCGYDRQGREVSGGSPSGGNGSDSLPGYLPGSSPGGVVGSLGWGDGTLPDFTDLMPDGVPRTNKDTREATGNVRKGVTRLVITWQGAQPVTVPVRGPYWVGRAVLPPGEHDIITPATIVAYDKASHVVGHSRIIG